MILSIQLSGCACAYFTTLEAGEGPDPGAHDDIARPVLALIHARETDERRARIENRPDDPFELRIFPAHFTRRGGGRGERDRRMARGKRCALIVAKSGEELERVRIRVRRDIGSRAADEPFENLSDRRARDRGFRCMPAEVFHFVVVRDAPREIKRRCDDVHAG